MHRRHFLGVAAGTLAAGLAPSVATRASGTATPAATATPASLESAAGFTAARRFLRTRAGEIAYVEHGAGDAALFLHGFPLNGYQWRGALARLSAYRRCVAPDFLGKGYTRVADGQSLAPQAQAEMLAELLDALAIDAVDIVANDSGGAVAQLFLRSYPQRVRSMLLTNCDAEIDCPPAVLEPVIALAREQRFVAEWLAPWLADKDLARSPQGLGGLTYTRPHELSDETIDMYLAPLVRNAAATNAFAVALEPNALAGIAPVLRASRVPVRIVWGSGDKTFSADTPAYLDRAFGNSRGIRWVEGANLFFPEEYPELIAAEARALWGIA